MSISAYSVTMALFWFTLAALIGSVTLRKITRGGLLFISILFILTLVRGFLPYEFSGSIIVRSKTWYPFLQTLIQWEILPSVTVGIALLWVWLGISAFHIRKLFKKLSELCLFQKSASVEPPESKFSQLAQEVAMELHCKAAVSVHISAKTATAYQGGFCRPFVVLPVHIAEFTTKEIRNMLRHELSHFLCNDLWIKSAVKLLLCFLWWNPVSKLLDDSIEQMLELRCDKRACHKMTPDERHDYLNTLLHLARANTEAPNPLTASCLGSNDDERIRQRFLLITEAIANPSRDRKMIPALVLSVLLFVASYTFTVQPWIDAPPIDIPNITVVRNGTDTVNLNTVIVPDGTYIVHTANNEYELYIDFEYICNFPAGELQKEPYCNYPIYEGVFPVVEAPQTVN